MTGKKGLSGRQKSQQTLFKEAVAKAERNLPALFDSLIARALKGDRDATIYLIDRVLGKPKITGSLEIDADTALFLQVQRIWTQLDKPLLTQPNEPDIIEIEQGSQEEVHKDATE